VAGAAPGFMAVVTVHPDGVALVGRGDGGVQQRHGWTPGRRPRDGWLLAWWSAAWRPLWLRGRHSGWTGELALLRSTARPWTPVLAFVEAPSLWRLAAPAEIFSESLAGSNGATRLFSPAWCGWWQRSSRSFLVWWRWWLVCGGGAASAHEVCLRSAGWQRFRSSSRCPAA
jgi:hypothetical protein